MANLVVTPPGRVHEEVERSFISQIEQAGRRHFGGPHLVQMRDRLTHAKLQTLAGTCLWVQTVRPGKTGGVKSAIANAVSRNRKGLGAMVGQIDAGEALCLRRKQIADPIDDLLRPG